MRKKSTKTDRHDFQHELRSLTDDEFDALYIRLRGYARHLLSTMFGPLVRELDPEDLVHHAYLRVETGASATSSADTLFFHLANVMQHRAQKAAARKGNTLPHLVVVAGEATEGGTISADALEASPADDPWHRAVASECFRRILDYFAGKLDLLRYIDFRLEYPGISAAEYAALMDLDVQDIRRMNRALRRGFVALQEEQP